MKALAPRIIYFSLLLAASTRGEEIIERLDPALDAIIAPGTEIETLCTGFDWSEGPVWDKKEERLLFSDVPRNTIHEWRPGASKAEVFMKPSGFTGIVTKDREPGSNGLAINANGELVICEHGDRRVSVLTRYGGKRTLADNWEGKRFNSPNDLAIRRNGDVYFTDPPYGLKGPDEEAAREIEHHGVYRIGTDRKVTLLTKELDRPNGIAFSPDETILYVAQSHKPLPIIMAYPLNRDGTLGKGNHLINCTNLSGPGMPDGLKVRSDGTIFATGPGGLLIIDPSGKLLGRILCGRSTANIAFGPNEKEIFLTSDDRILRVALTPAAK